MLSGLALAIPLVWILGIQCMNVTPHNFWKIDSAVLRLPVPRCVLDGGVHMCICLYFHSVEKFGSSGLQVDSTSKGMLEYWDCIMFFAWK